MGVGSKSSRHFRINQSFSQEACRRATYGQAAGSNVRQRQPILHLCAGYVNRRNVGVRLNHGITTGASENRQREAAASTWSSDHPRRRGLPTKLRYSDYWYFAVSSCSAYKAWPSALAPSPSVQLPGNAALSTVHMLIVDDPHPTVLSGFNALACPSQKR